MLHKRQVPSLTVMNALGQIREVGVGVQGSTGEVAHVLSGASIHLQGV